ncbi:unnamed protein product [Ilex paraguariensis]|uniref:Cytochrome b5 heme-binding domain-containing protein n=1 Tax=Ilex paraguariensis TaxID=185542 RepID=A0ABC8SA95_9AQUA
MMSSPFVSMPVNQDGVEAQKIVQDIGGIDIKDECAGGAGINHNQNSGILWKNKLPSNAGSQKDATVGSLSFNVIDASPNKQTREFSKQEASKDVGNSLKALQELKNPARKPAPRTKVPFEKGYSQMDWLKLTRTHPDLAGLKGQSNRRQIPMNEVKQHQVEGSMWTVLKGHVYNLAPYMKFHPGGVDILMKAVGKDCTSLFKRRT